MCIRDSVGDIAMVREGLAAELLDLLDDEVGRPGRIGCPPSTDVVHYDLGAALGKSKSVCATQTAPSPGHDCHFAFEADSHPSTSFSHASTSLEDTTQYHHAPRQPRSQRKDDKVPSASRRRVP